MDINDMPVEDSKLNNGVVSIGEWILTVFISGIPLVGFIMLFVWGFGGGTNKSKANLCKALIILYVISGILIAISFALFGVAAMNMANMNY